MNNTVNTTNIEALWGEATLAKKVSHYSRLRLGQLKARQKRHQKRITDMLAMQARLAELNINITGEAFRARLKFEQALRNAARKEYNYKLNQTPEQQKETQLAYRRTAV